MERSANIRVPASARRGEVIRVRCMIMHPMENGYRMDSHGTMVPIQLIHTFACRYNGEEVFRATLGTGVSANPNLAFHLLARESGTIEFTWYDDDGAIYEDTKSIEIA